MLLVERWCLARGCGLRAVHDQGTISALNDFGPGGVSLSHWAGEILSRAHIVNLSSWNIVTLGGEDISLLRTEVHSPWVAHCRPIICCCHTSLLFVNIELMVLRTTSTAHSCPTPLIFGVNSCVTCCCSSSRLRMGY